jgi:hypothetical protein
MEQPNKGDLSPRESLQIIQRMIDHSKRKVNENGWYLILWGAVLGLAHLAMYILLKLDVEMNFDWIWYPAIGIGVLGSMLYGFLWDRKRKKGTFLDNIIGMVWLTFLFSWGLALIFDGKMENEGIFIYLMSANAVLLTGIIIRYKPVMFGSLFLYGIALAALIMLPNLSLEFYLFQAIAFIGGFLVPGLMLNRWVGKQDQMQNA